MKKTASDLIESKLKRGLSIRLDPEPLVAYEECVVAAGLNVTGALRTSVLSTLETYRQLETNGFQISFSFTRKLQEGIDHFPELLGSVTFEVIPPAGLTVEHLHRLVFVVPEFVLENSHEPFRIDSAYFHRVVNNNREIISDKVTRNALSFRLICGTWRASIFDYNSGLDPSQIELQCADAFKKTVAATIACFITHQLPDTRILTINEVEALNAILSPHQYSR